LTTLNRKGREFFSSIGKKGHEVLRFKYPGMASAWGKLGGRPKKSTLYQPEGGMVKQKKEDRIRLASIPPPPKNITSSLNRQIRNFSFVS